MSFALRFEPETGVVIANCSGDLRLEDAKEGARSMWTNPDWIGRPIVWDFRSARLELSNPEVQEIAQFILARQPPAPPPKVAFVTARDVDFGLVRMFAAFREHALTDVRVFRDYDEAISWARGDGAEIQ